MKKYSSYKSSGIEWIGDIPETWDCGKMKYVLSNNDGGVWGSDIENEEDGNIVIRSTEITIDGNWDFSNPLKRVLTENEVIKSKLYEGDIVITKSSGSPQHIGKSVIVSKEIELLNCCYSNFVQRIRFRNYNPKLYHFILNSDIGRSQFKYLTTSSTGLGNLNGSSLNDILLPFIPLQEQEQIVNYLDEKTTIIDKLISTKQRKVELLKEQRTSLVNQVITKGLNPNVKMKDSGVEWIGEIPEEWNIVPLFTISRHTKEKNEDNEKVVLSLSYGKIKVRDVESNFGLLPESFNDYQRIRPEYIVLRLTDLQNDKKSLRVGLSTLNGIITPVYVSLKTNEKMLSKFLFYHLYNSDLKKILYTLGGGLRQTLRFDELKKFPVPLMSLVEQQKIIEYLDKQTKEIDDLVSMEQNKIELLKEYRQSLISEVITGKIKIL
jgi:type I restriction enzyme S subunit